MRYAILSALAIMAAVDFFSVRSISKVIDRKQNGHTALHGLYVKQPFACFENVSISHTQMPCQPGPRAFILKNDKGASTAVWPGRSSRFCDGMGRLHQILPVFAKNGATGRSVRSGRLLA